MQGLEVRREGVDEAAEDGLALGCGAGGRAADDAVLGAFGHALDEQERPFIGGVVQRGGAVSRGFGQDGGQDRDLEFTGVHVFVVVGDEVGGLACSLPVPAGGEQRHGSWCRRVGGLYHVAFTDRDRPRECPDLRLHVDYMCTTRWQRRLAVLAHGNPIVLAPATLASAPAGRNS
jgi:hypothetical protein